MTHTAALFDAAVNEHLAGRLAEAVQLYRQVLAADPRHALAWHQLGLVEMQGARCEAAEPLLRRAIQLDGGRASLHHNLGTCCRMLGKLADAEDCYEQALRLEPDNLVTRAHWTQVLYARSDRAKANRAALETLGRERDSADAHVMCGLLHLLRGELAEGFAEQEWRLIAQPPRQSLPAERKWDGRPLNGKSILIHAEQGLGETLQYCRYVQLVRQHGGRPVLAAQRALLPLLRQSAIGDVAPVEDPWPECEVHVPLLSLPAVLGTTLATIPAEAPYLQADEQRVDTWRQRLCGYPKLRVGIHWQGARTYVYDRTRSIPLVEFAALAQVPGVQLISLQKGPGSEQLAEAGAMLGAIDLGGELDNGPGAFLDTAAVMRGLDLVITSDTSIAHLAGALGVRVWTLLSTMADARWLLDREDSPWYPTMRLWRQQHIGAWSPVFARIAAELHTLVAAAPRS